MADVQEHVLGSLELEEALFGAVADLGAQAFGSLFDSADVVALMGIEHEAGWADYAGLGDTNQKQSVQ